MTIAMNWNDVASLLISMSSVDLGSGATQQQIDEAERRLGVPIRGSYRDFLLRFGWGGVEDFELFGLGSGVPNFLNLEKLTLSERREMRPRLPPHLLPLMNDGGGNLYCLDTKGAGPEPPVVLWLHDEPETQSPEQQAPAFVDWLASLLHERSG